MAILAVRCVQALLLIITLVAAASQALASNSGEYTIKAIYIYNFAKFTTWPAESFQSSDAELNFCVLGEDPFGLAINEIAGKRVRNRMLTIKLFPRVAVVSGCHIVFISRSEHSRLELILESIDQFPILTVSDIESFSERGGMVTLLTRDQLVQFSINSQAAGNSGIRFSSKLLELASVVVGQSR